MLNNLETVWVIGDITIKADDFMAVILVDDKTVLSIPRQDHGLDVLAAVLTDLVK